ncbi:MAG TPA: hypothetical protein VFA64_04675 [Hyphomicrobiaceae bacterium]|nr:hypothetical protein [Hyphomicrobiaceae bacterium]
MLSKSRCPHTGVVNFFTQADPLLSVGSVAAMGVAGPYVWRCYVGDESGLAPDMPLAEAHLRRAFADSAEQRREGARRRPEPARQSRAAAYWQKLNDVNCCRP